MICLSLLHSSRAALVRLDQCAYKHQLPGASPFMFCRKATGIASNLPNISECAMTCPGVCTNHLHERAWGGRKVEGVWVSLAAAAGRYPDDLCRVLARIVRAQLEVDRAEFGRHGSDSTRKA